MTTLSYESATVARHYGTTQQFSEWQPPLRANFSHSLGAVERELEALLLQQAPQLRDTLNRVLEHTARGPQRERPGRSYPRQSRRPSKKWWNRKPADPQNAD